MNAPPSPSNTLKAAVIGWPVDHSRSPLIHGTWLKELGIDGSYNRVALAPDDAPDWFARFLEHGLVGANVTIPHKETAFAACQKLTQRAARLGAVNTLWLDNGVLCGDSTDGEGFVANLDARAPAWRSILADTKTVILGAGGAARGIVDALCEAGAQDVVILNRTEARAETLCNVLGETFQTVRFYSGSLDAFADHAPETGLLINTTSLGMVGKGDLTLPLGALNPSAIVTDIVYTPLITPLLQQAAARDHTVVDGLGMLLHQAVPGFELWFGKRPTVTEHLRNLVIADLNKIA